MERTKIGRDRGRKRRKKCERKMFRTIENKREKGEKNRRERDR